MQNDFEKQLAHYQFYRRSQSSFIHACTQVLKLHQKTISLLVEIIAIHYKTSQRLHDETKWVLFVSLL